MQQATTARQQELVTHWMMRQLDQEELFREEFLQSPDQRSVSIQQNRTELHRHEQLADEQRLLQEQRQRQSQRQQHLTPALQTVLQDHLVSLGHVAGQLSQLLFEFKQKNPLGPSEHAVLQRQAIQLQLSFMQLQSTQRHLFQQQRQQHRYELRKRNPAPQNQQGQRQDTNQSTLLHVMEHLQNLIDAYQSTLYLLDKTEAAFPTPWFIDSAEDEQQLIDFMDRAPRLKAFGSDSLMLSNHQVLQSIGQRWSDLRVLSLMVLKCSVFQPGQRHVELNSLFNRCPSRLESLQLSFSSNAVYRLLSNDIFNETHKNNNDNAEGGEGGSVVVSVCPPLPEILTLRRVFIEANLGAFSGTNVPTHFEDEHSWINLLRRCPNLESLGLHSCSPAFFHLVANKAMDHWPLLQKFATYAIWTDFVSQLDQGIAALLNATRLPDDDETDSISSSTTSSSYLTGRVRMKKVRSDRIALTIQSATLQSLFRLSKTLTHLSLRNCQITGGSPSEALLRILRACDRLEEVDLLPSGGHYLATIMMLEAKHFVKFLSLETDNPWPSAQILRVLRVAMIGFNRPLSGSNSAVISSAASSSSSSYWSTVLQHITATTTALSPWELTMLSGRPSQLQYQRGTASASLTSVPVHSPLEALYGLQREVCQILGSFTSLEVLTLGVQADKDPMGALIPQMYQQTKCLELMLKSGLNLMGGLKRLRVLNIPRMAHRIGLHELVWMRHQWPRLRVVEGLLRVENMKCQRVAYLAMTAEEREDEKEKERLVVQWIKEEFSWLKYN